MSTRSILGMVAATTVTTLLGARSVESAVLNSSALAAEWDFRVADSYNLSYASPGASTQGVSSGGVVNPGPTGISSLDPKLTNGYLDSSAGGVMSDPSDGWNSYAGTLGFGSATIVVVFQPNFNGTNTFTRHTFFNHADANLRQSILFNEPDEPGMGPYLALGRVGENQVEVAAPDLSYDSSKWYFLAASWDEDADPTASPTHIYVREMTVGSVASGASNTADVKKIEGYNLGSPLFVGERSNGTDVADGKFALLQLYKTYATPADLDALYEAMVTVPEPASLGLSMIGGCVLLSLRRRRGGAR